MGRAGALIGVLGGALAAAPAARAGSCADAGARGPLWLAPGPADFGQVLEPCAATDLGLRLRGELLVDRPGFYGMAAAGGTLRGRLQLGGAWVVTAAIDPITYRLAANAVVQATGAAAGPATVGAAHLLAAPDLAAAIHARLLLPFDGARRHGGLWGGEVGLSVARALPRALWLQGGLTIPTTLAVVQGAGHLAVRPAGLVELAWGPRPWAAIALGSAARAELEPVPAVLALSARGSGRLLLGRSFELGAGIEAPLAGVERTDLVGSVFLSWAPDRPRFTRGSGP